MSLEQDIECQAVEIILQKLYGTLKALFNVSGPNDTESIRLFNDKLDELKKAYALRSTLIRYHGLINNENVLAKALAESELHQQTTHDDMSNALEDEVVFTRFIISFGVYWENNLSLAKMLSAGLTNPDLPKDKTAWDVDITAVNILRGKAVKAYQELCDEIN